MNPEPLPQFPYNRDVAASDSIVASDQVCECCGASRGYIYVNNIYTTHQVEHLCPWCIADGSAARKFSAHFIDGDFYDENDDQVELSAEYRDAVFSRTVGFSTFNPVSWWVHCGEPAAYVKRESDYGMLFQCRKCNQFQVMMDYD
ncbi:MAG: CbrC family protein [Planctomycetales bacterium]